MPSDEVSTQQSISSFGCFASNAMPIRLFACISQHSTISLHALHLLAACMLPQSSTYTGSRADQSGEQAIVRGMNNKPTAATQLTSLQGPLRRSCIPVRSFIAISVLLRQLRTACQRAKCTLSSSTQAHIETDSLFKRNTTVPAKKAVPARRHRPSSCSRRAWCAIQVCAQWCHTCTL
jgi:hypothetical protein